MKRVLLLFALLIALGIPALSAAQTTVILVRHAEKAEAPASDPPLTDAGRKRAQRLAEYLQGANVSVVYSTPFARARETAAPLVDRGTAKLVETQVTNSYATGVVSRIKAENTGKTVVVVGHSNTTPQVVKALTGIDVPAIPETDYDNIYIVTIAADGKTSLIRAKY